MNFPMTPDQANLVASVCQHHALDVPGAGDVVQVFSDGAASVTPPAQVAYIDLTDEQAQIAIAACQIDTTRITDGIRGIASEMQRVYAVGGINPPPEPDPDLQPEPQP